MKKAQKYGGVWSAAPTPFTDRMDVDTIAVRRMVGHHLRLGVSGLFLAGTNGEGPWLPERSLRTLVAAVVKAAAGRMTTAVQVTDNSAARILDNARRAAADGADLAVIAPPNFAMSYASARDREKRLRDLYLEAIRESPLPVAIYDRGGAPPVAMPASVLEAAYAESKVVAVKDSSVDDAHLALALEARRKRPRLALFCGYEFDCVKYLQAGYDGLLLGGGVFNGGLAGRIFAAVRDGDFALAGRLQARMNRLMYAVYGGRKIRTWLSGEKYLLVRMGIFRTWRNFPDYPLRPRDRRTVEAALARHRDILLP
jgi:4-hydroxy-tetrahydrodipicolinate synthase